jgi:hypothetical protein
MCRSFLFQSQIPSSRVHMANLRGIQSRDGICQLQPLTNPNWTIYRNRIGRLCYPRWQTISTESHKGCHHITKNNQSCPHLGNTYHSVQTVAVNVHGLHQCRGLLGESKRSSGLGYRLRGTIQSKGRCGTEQRKKSEGSDLHGSS